MLKDALDEMGKFASKGTECTTINNQFAFGSFLIFFLFQLKIKSQTTRTLTIVSSLASCKPEK